MVPLSPRHVLERVSLDTMSEYGRLTLSLSPKDPFARRASMAAKSNKQSQQDWGSKSGGSGGQGTGYEYSQDGYEYSQDGYDYSQGGYEYSQSGNSNTQGK